MFHKYLHIRQLGHKENETIFSNPEDEIVIQAKYDGGNFRFMRKGDQLIFGSRNNELGPVTEKNWKRCIEFVKQKFVTQPEMFEEGYIYFGECMVSHTLSYDWERIPPFLGFDIQSLSSGKYLKYSETKRMFNQIGLEMVPVVQILKAKDIKPITDESIGISKYAPRTDPTQQDEGWVIKNYSRQVMAKWVRTKFKERNKKCFGTSKKFATNDDERIVAIYCTNARIEKGVFKLVDEGHEIGMELMHHLPKLIITDIWEEHWNEISFSNWSINFKQIRKKVATRCISVLKQIMVNNALGKTNGKILE